MTAIANARQSVAAPVRKPRRFGIFSVVTPHDGGDQFWMLGGLTADGEQCSTPLANTIPCGPMLKSARSWYSDLDGDAWMAHMYETCKTVGRFEESQAKLRQRFLAAEQSAVEFGLQYNVLRQATSLTANDSVSRAVGDIEAEAAAEYGGQIIIHMGFEAAEDYARGSGLIRVGDHLETVAGNLVVVGNYQPVMNGGSAGNPAIYGTGAIELYRSDLSEVPAQYGFNNNENDYYTLVERAYAAIVDCFLVSATATLCQCGTGGSPV